MRFREEFGVKVGEKGAIIREEVGVIYRVIYETGARVRGDFRARVKEEVGVTVGGYIWEFFEKRSKSKSNHESLQKSEKFFENKSELDSLERSECV